ncbi:c-type cytochrome [Acidicapsa dinghuensis]|uniref:C-type cytochrome n=1 Tax=Acidicapsa dinghuensis TaxID=2218256 RepID=A0ABW1EEF4_9BACT|nr:cytochrome c [Acidicapsa dinghuensis]
MVKSLLLAASVILFGAAPAINPGSAAWQPSEPSATGVTGQGNPVKATAESQAKAKKLYNMDCALCHGESGDGKTDLAKDMQLTLSDLTDPKSLADQSDAVIFDVIRKGKDKMPPEEPARAKDDDIWNLVIYVRSLSKGGGAAAGSGSK